MDVLMFINPAILRGLFLCVRKLHPTGRKYRPVDYSGAAVFYLTKIVLQKNKINFFVREMLQTLK